MFDAALAVSVASHDRLIHPAGFFVTRSGTSFETSAGAEIDPGSAIRQALRPPVAA